MIETPFLGDHYNYILPGSMLLFSLAFIILNICNYESKTVNVLKKMNGDKGALSNNSDDNDDLHPLFD